MDTNNQITLTLTGELAQKYTPHLELYATSAAMAIRGLIANFPEIENDIKRSDREGISYRLIAGNRELGINDLHGKLTHDLTLMPVVDGSGAGLRILGGVALIGASFAFTGGVGAAALGAAATTSTQTLVSGLLLSTGLSLAFGGIASLLTPKPQEVEDESFLFPNSVFTSQGGAVVPILVGEPFVRLTNPIVLSSSINTEDIPVNFISTGSKGGK